MKKFLPENKISKSYLDAMKALQETCRKLRGEISILKEREENLEEKLEFQKKLYEEKIEDIIKKSLDNEKKLKQLLQQKDNNVESLLDKNKEGVKMKKQILKETSILQKSINLLEESLENEKKSKNIALKNIQEKDRLLQETKFDLIKVIEESKKIQEQLSAEIALFDQRNQELTIQISNMEKEKMNIIKKMQNMNKELKNLLIQNEEMNMKNNNLQRKLSMLENHLSSQDDIALEQLARKDHEISTLMEKLQKTKILIKKYRKKTQEEARIDKNIVNLLEKSTKISNQNSISNILNKVEELVIDNNKLKRENLVELKVLEFIEK